MKSSKYDSLESLVSNEVILVPLGEEIPLERGHQALLTSFPLVPTSMTLNDLEPQKYGF